jgi:hypothetical protein
MSLVQKLGLDSFRTNRSSSPLNFPPLDAQVMARRLDLEAEAQRQAINGLPLPGSKSIDSVEAKIINELQGEVTQSLSQFEAWDNSYRERVRDAAMAMGAIDIHDIAQGTISKFGNLTQIGVDRLIPARKEVVETEAELLRFRVRHRLERPPIRQGQKSLKVGILLLILLLEATLNGKFLSAGSQLGLLGGVFDATILAAINVAVGWMAGRLVVGLLSHQNFALKAFGLVPLAIWLAATFVFNLGVAHYRNAMAADDPTLAAQVAFGSLLSSPLQLDSVESVQLLILGLLFSMVAAIDGWCFDDPYPGYGRRHRHNLSAMESYSETSTYLLEELQEVRDNAAADITKATRDLPARRDLALSIHANRQKLHREIEQHFSHIEVVGNTLLRIYRDLNVTARSTPAPAYFDTSWTLERPNLPELPPVGQGLPDETQIAEAQRAAREHLDSLETAYRGAIAKYTAIEQLTRFSDRPPSLPPEH